jgi:serine/threonine protein kinase
MTRQGTNCVLVSSDCRSEAVSSFNHGLSALSQRRVRLRSENQLMIETPHCLAPDQLRKLAEGVMSGAELAIAEEHLSSCPSCRTALDETIAQFDQSQRIGESTNGDREAAARRREESFRSQYLGILSLLAPSDDPEHMGRIAHYDIVGILGQGGMGVVFKGFDTSLNRHVAIKMLLPHLAASGLARKQFAREAQAAAAVVDDHVVAIHSVAEWQGAPYFVMPYVQGMSLHERLKNKRPLDLQEILRIGAQTARGLAAAHKRGLVHRDVKPANILLPDGADRIALTDFGLARAVDDMSVTRTDAIVGTPRYMSPEQARGQAVDFRSDLFSLGSVLYAMCTGDAPFRAESNYGVLRVITDEDPRPIAQINAKIPAWLCRLIDKLMDKQPEQRCGSAREVAELLERCLAHVQNPASAELPPSVAEPSSPSAKPPIRGRRVIAIACLIAAVPLLFGFAVLTGIVKLPSKETSPQGGVTVTPPSVSLREQRAAKASEFVTALQGTWQMVGGVNDQNVKTSEDYASKVTFTVLGDTIEMYNALDPAAAVKTRFAINVEEFPTSDGVPKPFAFIDLPIQDAAGTPHTMVGLFDVDGDTLKICWGPVLPDRLGPAPGIIYAELKQVQKDK